VTGITIKYNIKVSKFKTFYDLSYLVVAVVMSLIFFKSLVGISFGTVILAVTNGSVIGFFFNLIEKRLNIIPLFPKFAKLFTLP
jgi:uncharacterized membrane protein YczE